MIFRDALKRIAAREPLQVRIGISTGPVVVGETGAGDAAVPKLAVGETPNIAARLQGVAQPDQVVIGPATRRLIGQIFELDEQGLHTLKGITEPMAAWVALRLKTTKDRFEALRGGAPLTQHVGREEELALLSRRWQQTLDGEGQVAQLCGEAGIGKSRGTQELLSLLCADEHVALIFQCYPYHTNSSFHPVITQFEQVAGFQPDDNTEVKLDKLEAAMQSFGGVIPLARALFASLLSLPVDCYPPLHFSPQREKEELINARVEQLIAMSARKPVLLVLEDAHWIDPSTLELLGVAVQRVRTARVMLLVTHRPEFDPPWKGQPHVTSLTLNRLTKRQSAQLVARLTHGIALPPPVLDAILAKTEGIPLFTEELTKAVIESGVVERKGDIYVLVRSVHDLAIPATLQDSLLARLDRLAAVKEIAQIAACIGREFSQQLLAAIADRDDAELTRALDALVAAELVFRTNSASSFIFKHALVQEAAYQSLLISRRHDVHARIAATIEAQFPDIAANSPEIVAHHFGRANRAAQAVPYWIAARQRALVRSAAPEAVLRLNAALDANTMLPATTERDAREVDIRQMLSIAYLFVDGWGSTKTESTLEHAASWCQSSTIPVAASQCLDPCGLATPCD